MRSQALLDLGIADDIFGVVVIDEFELPYRGIDGYNREEERDIDPEGIRRDLPGLIGQSCAPLSAPV